MNVSLKVWQKHLETGIKYLGESNTHEAERHLQQSLVEAEALDVPVLIAFSQRLLATAQVRNNKIEEAEVGFKRALQICQELDNNKGIAEAQAGLASVCFLKGIYHQAVYLYKQAIYYYPKESSPLRLAVLYTDLGQVYARMKKWQHAESTFITAGDLCNQNGYLKGEAEICLYLGETKYTQGDLETAKVYFLKASQIFGMIGENISLANSQQYLSFLYLEKQKIFDALQLQYRVVALYLRFGTSIEISESYYLLSNILQFAKLLDEAEVTMKNSLSYYNGYEFGLAVRYHSLAVISIMKKEYEEARNHYFEALKYFQLYGDGTKIGDISEELTYLLKYENLTMKGSFFKWLAHRSVDHDAEHIGKTVPKYEIMIQLANNLQDKGNNIAALKCGWKALEVAQAMKCETQEIESFIQTISEKIRRKK